jgi:hypothetical protein
VNNAQAGIFAQGLEQKVKSDAHINMPTQQPKHTALGPGVVALHQTKKEALLKIASESCPREKERYLWEGCPNLTMRTAKRKRLVQHVYALRGVQYNEGKGYLLFNTHKLGHLEGDTVERDICLWHVAYHTKYHNGL